MQRNTSCSFSSKRDIIEDTVEIRYVLKQGEIEATLSSFGATLVKLVLPGKSGQLDDCVLGFDSMAEYDRHRSYTNCFGATIGRVANRMANAQYAIDGQTVQLDKNCGEHHLHGGAIGWHRRNWKSHEILNGVEFTYISEDGDDEYPATVIAKIRYTLNDNKLKISYEAALGDGETKSSPINLTNHSYFNLGGHAAENGILSHELQVYAEAYCPTNKDAFPTRECKSLDQEPVMDFRKSKKMETAFRDLGAAQYFTQDEIDQSIDRIENSRGSATGADPLGFDHNYVLSGFDAPEGYANCPLRPIAKLLHHESGRSMKMSSTTPGMQVYTANKMKPCPGKGGAIYKQWAGIALETQNYPDSINVDAGQFVEYAKGQTFILRPDGRPYFHEVEFSFEIEDFVTDDLMKMLE